MFSREELLDLSAQPAEEIRLLRTTPAAGSIGTCRYKLKSEQQEDFEPRHRRLQGARSRLLLLHRRQRLDGHRRQGRAAWRTQRGLDLVAVGVSKTIDNDVGDSEFKLIDHTPGYGSVARYWACNVQDANEENMGSSPADPVLVIQVMGRKIGFIPAAARLARSRTARCRSRSTCANPG